MEQEVEKCKLPERSCDLLNRGWNISLCLCNFIWWELHQLKRSAVHSGVLLCFLFLFALQTFDQSHRVTRQEMSSVRRGIRARMATHTTMEMMLSFLARCENLAALSGSRVSSACRTRNTHQRRRQNIIWVALYPVCVGVGITTDSMRRCHHSITVRYSMTAVGLVLQYTVYCTYLYAVKMAFRTIQQKQSGF